MNLAEVSTIELCRMIEAAQQLVPDDAGWAAILRTELERREEARRRAEAIEATEFTLPHPEKIRSRIKAIEAERSYLRRLLAVAEQAKRIEGSDDQE